MNFLVRTVRRRPKRVIVISDDQLRGFLIEGTMATRQAWIPDGRGALSYEEWMPGSEELDQCLCVPLVHPEDDVRQFTWLGWDPTVSVGGRTGLDIFRQMTLFGDTLTIDRSQVDEVWLAIGSTFPFMRNHLEHPALQVIGMVEPLAMAVVKVMEQLGDLFPEARVVYLGTRSTQWEGVRGPGCVSAGECKALARDCGKMTGLVVAQAIGNYQLVSLASGNLKPGRFGFVDAFEGWQEEKHFSDSHGTVSQAGYRRVLFNLRKEIGKDLLGPVPGPM